MWSEQGDTPAPVPDRHVPGSEEDEAARAAATPRPIPRTSANATPRAGMRVSCCGDEFILTHYYDGRWWGPNLGPQGKHHTTFVMKVPLPFIFLE